MTSSYDSFDGFKKALTSLDNFNALIRERHQAGYVRKEPLQEWVILGRFYFDSCGNCMKYTGDPIPANVFPRLRPIMAKDDFWYYVELSSPPDKDYLFTCSIGSGIPPASLICPECKKDWDVSNCHDTVVVHKTDVINLDGYGGTDITLGMMKELWSTNKDAIWRVQPDCSIRNDRNISGSNKTGWIAPEDDYQIRPDDEAMVNIWTYRHHRCHRQHQAQTEREYFENIFKEAGYKKVSLTQIANQYCPCDHCAPWYEVVADGLSFTIGWRKRVISIQSTDSRIVFDKIYPKENVTKSTHEIHAWGREKCVEYLKLLKQLIK